MIELFILFGVVLFAVFVIVILVPAPGSDTLELCGDRSIRDEDRGSVMTRIARWVVLGLGRITFAALHVFEKLGVDMAREDEVIASWTAWSENIKASLAAALADAQTLRDTDAAEDAAQANTLSEALADKLQAAFDAVSAPPVAEPPVEPPVEEPPVDSGQ